MEVTLDIPYDDARNRNTRFLIQTDYCGLPWFYTHKTGQIWSVFLSTPDIELKSGYAWGQIKQRLASQDVTLRNKRLLRNLKI